MDMWTLMPTEGETELTTSTDAPTEGDQDSSDGANVPLQIDADEGLNDTPVTCGTTICMVSVWGLPMAIRSISFDCHFVFYTARRILLQFELQYLCANGIGLHCRRVSVLWSRNLYGTLLVVVWLGYFCVDSCILQ